MANVQGLTSCRRPTQKEPSTKSGAPLTLDLLMDHQGEVVHLQDVGEHAQCVSQVDLQEKLCPCWPSEPSAPIDWKARQHGTLHSCSGEIQVNKRPRAHRAVSRSVFWHPA